MKTELHPRRSSFALFPSRNRLPVLPCEAPLTSERVVLELKAPEDTKKVALLRKLRQAGGGKGDTSAGRCLSRLQYKSTVAGQPSPPMALFPARVLL